MFLVVFFSFKSMVTSPVSVLSSPGISCISSGTMSVVPGCIVVVLLLYVYVFSLNCMIGFSRSTVCWLVVRMSCAVLAKFVGMSSIISACCGVCMVLCTKLCVSS